jgi:Rad3-related DNA helicase
VEEYKPCKTEDFVDALPWLNDISFSVQALIEASLNSKFKKGDNTEIKKQKIRMELVEAISSVITNSESTRYIVECQKDGVTMVPYRVDNLSQYIFDTTEKVILMSATIPDVKTYAKTLGIENYKFINIKSSFPPENSPIYCYTKYPLNYANIEKNLPKVAEMAKKLSKHHADTKGIIHTHTFKITQALKGVVGGDSRFLFREDGIYNEDIVEMHSMSKAPTVLVSPSLAFGLDLKDDLGRWQIIMKIPYFPLNNKRIKLLAEEDPEWYNMKVLVTFIQACGRCTRSKEDHSVTYILDGMSEFFIKKNAHLMEDYFIKRVH